MDKQTRQETLNTLKRLLSRYSKKAEELHNYWAEQASEAFDCDAEPLTMLTYLGEIDGCLEPETLLRSVRNAPAFELHAVVISVRAIVEPLERDDISTARQFIF